LARNRIRRWKNCCAKSAPLTSGLKPFLTANWRYLAMMNFVVDPQILAQFVPEGLSSIFSRAKLFSASSAFFFSFACSDVAKTRRSCFS
jgi:hypothetical protein